MSALKSVHTKANKVIFRKYAYLSAPMAVHAEEINCIVFNVGWKYTCLYPILTHSDVIFSGAQGEYAGLRAIMAYLHAIEETQRKVGCSICSTKWKLSLVLFEKRAFLALEQRSNIKKRTCLCKKKFLFTVMWPTHQKCSNSSFSFKLPSYSVIKKQPTYLSIDEIMGCVSAEHLFFKEWPYLYNKNIQKMPYFTVKFSITKKLSFVT